MLLLSYLALLWLLGMWTQSWTLNSDLNCYGASFTHWAISPALPLPLYTEGLQSPIWSWYSIRCHFQVKAMEECQRTDFPSSAASQGKECRQRNKHRWQNFPIPSELWTFGYLQWESDPAKINFSIESRLELGAGSSPHSLTLIIYDVSGTCHLPGWYKVVILASLLGF